MRGFYAILDATPSCWPIGAALEARARKLLAAAPCCLQLRAKAVGARALEAAARRLLPLCRAAGRPVLRQRSPRRRARRRRGRRPPRPGRSAARRRAARARGRRPARSGDRFLHAQPGPGACRRRRRRRLHRLRAGVRHAQQAEPGSDGGPGGCSPASAAPSKVPVVAIGGITLDAGPPWRRGRRVAPPPIIAAVDAAAPGCRPPPAAPAWRRVLSRHGRGCHRPVSADVALPG